jgi:hypothetical protein
MWHEEEKLSENKGVKYPSIGWRLFGSFLFLDFLTVSPAGRGGYFGGELPNGVVHGADGGVGVLAHRETFEHHVIVEFRFHAARRFREIDQIHLAEADGIRCDAFDVIGGTLGFGGAGDQPRLIQGRAHQIGIAAVHDDAFGQQFDDAAADRPALLDAACAQFLDVLEDGGVFDGGRILRGSCVRLGVQGRDCKDE